jgi:hypothetical protein
MMLCAKSFFCKFEVVVNLVGVLLKGPVSKIGLTLHVISKRRLCAKTTLIHSSFRERLALKQTKGHVISKPSCAKPTLIHIFFREMLALKQAKGTLFLNQFVQNQL